MPPKRKKPRNAFSFAANRPHTVKYLVNAAAIREVLSEECILSHRLGEMIEHFGPKMQMLNTTLAPDVTMNPCLNAFWELLERVSEKIECGEWT